MLFDACAHEAAAALPHQLKVPEMELRFLSPFRAIGVFRSVSFGSQAEITGWLFKFRFYLNNRHL
jgi:hypothetical protein